MNLIFREFSFWNDATIYWLTQSIKIIQNLFEVIIEYYFDQSFTQKYLKLINIFYELMRKTF